VNVTFLHVRFKNFQIKKQILFFTMNLKSPYLSALCLAMLVSGCSSINGDFGFGSFIKDLGNKTQQAEPTRTQSLLKAGAEYLQKGEIDKAQAVFNTGLKFDLNSAALHFFNAFAYQLKYEKGEMDSFASAEAGYRTAIGLDATLDVAYVQLGKLYMSSANYIEAKKAFALAVDSKQKTPYEGLFGLAQAAMLSGDTQTAVFATAKLDELNWQDPRLFRVKALLAAMAKQPQQAADMLERYSALEKNKKETRYVSTRVDQLLAMKTSYQSGDKNELKPRDIVLAQAKTEESTDKGKDATADKKTVAAEPSEERKNWFRCDPRPSPVSEKDTTPLLHSGSLPVNEENANATTLPAPCAGEKPPSAMIEVTMIRTEESVQKSYGINLLDGLNLGRSITQAADGGITKTAQLYNSLGADLNNTVVGATAAINTGMLNYSLNIANSLYQKNEVIARPTLAAVDRLPSVFFSGGNLSIKVSGTAGGVSTIVDKSIGVVLSITPTFLDDDHVLLNIRASRSFIENNPDTTNIALHLTRNSVNASALVRFGQTFILNGLVEREKDQVQNGVPVLQDIPVLQYFFKRSVTLDYNRQILTLITIRKLVDSDDSASKANDSKGALSTHKLSDEVDEFMGLQNNKPVMDEVIAGLRKDNFLYKRLSQRDVLQESYGSQKFLDRIITDLKDLLYF
jgi:tetratricopeptide (TPR) repeat protein